MIVIIIVITTTFSTTRILENNTKLPTVSRIFGIKWKFFGQNFILYKSCGLFVNLLTLNNKYFFYNYQQFILKNC